MKNKTLDYWQRIDSWIKENAPKIYSSLPSGATESEIESLEETLSITLPESCKETLKIHNGSNEQAIFDFGTLRSIESIIDEWEMLTDLWEDGDNDDSAEPPVDIKANWFNKNWVPFADDWCGNALCIDMDPTEKGTIGQIIEWSNTDGPSVVTDQSFEGFIKRFTEELEEGLFAVKTDQQGQDYLEKG